ncbi:hypothetical protein NC652_002476 [Populus alba x Populus x berolinensis]|nr:hypothetical protein NC652_002476 [Populus alba x Populus x berolinensis]
MIQAKAKLQVGQWSISVSYAFCTRPVTKHPCQKPFVFYMSSSKYDRARKQVIGVHARSYFWNCVAL